MFHKSNYLRIDVASVLSKIGLSRLDKISKILEDMHHGITKYPGEKIAE